MTWDEFLHEACYMDNLELAEHALREGTDPNATLDKDSNLHTPLFWAAEGGRMAMARLLLDAGAGLPQSRGMSPLRCTRLRSTATPQWWHCCSQPTGVWRSIGLIISAGHL